MHEVNFEGIATRFPLPSLDDQANLAEKHGIDTLFSVLTPGHCGMCSSTRTPVRWYALAAIAGIASIVGRAK